MFNIYGLGRKILMLVSAGLILASCSTTKEITTSSFTQSECRNEKTISNSNEFVSETAENLNVFQRGDLLTAAVDVETYCNAQLSFDVVKKDNELWLKLKNTSGVKDSCVCVKNVSIELQNVEPMDYKVFVTNLSGSQLLSKTTFTAK